MLMRHRQSQFETDRPRFYFLSTDASMQRGHDYLMSLEDSIAMEEASKLFKRSLDANTFSRSNVLQTCVLPTALVGAGHAALGPKFEAFVEALKLDVGVGSMAAYARRVVSFVSDYGTEGRFAEVIWHQEELLAF